ncbi:hypothetical protein MJO29_013270 [Puccinia striiformis f. sp. tritici]|nr:hypothetical protein MJO29_013270 [Puccinia striiformis f. sp. tritici]
MSAIGAVDELKASESEAGVRLSDRLALHEDRIPFTIAY